jgi:cytochrome c553
MKTITISFFTLICLLFSGGSYAQESSHVHKPHAHRHTEYAKKINPVPMTGQSIEKGREIFGKHCISCHGVEGKADGYQDFTDDIFIHGDSDGEIFHVITDGVKKTKMKGYQKELTDEMRWQLVNYIKSISAGAKLAARPGKQIREVNRDGFTLTYHLLDLSEREKMMKGMEGHSVVGMKKVADMTNHLMIYIKKPDGTIVPGDVAFLLTEPDGTDFRTMTMGMYGGYGADISLKLKGIYTIKSSISMESGRSPVRLDDEFRFHVN